MLLCPLWSRALRGGLFVVVACAGLLGRALTASTALAFDPLALDNTDPGRVKTTSIEDGAPYRIGALWWPDESNTWFHWDFDFRRYNLRFSVATDDPTPFAGPVIRAWMAWDVAWIFRGKYSGGDGWVPPTSPWPVRLWLKYGYDDRLKSRDIAYAELSFNLYGKLDAFDSETAWFYVEADLRRKFHYAGFELTNEAISLRLFYGSEEQDYGVSATVALPMIGRWVMGG
jgi:hypothetical protein